MTRRARIAELEAAALAINPESLQAAKAAIALNCEEYLYWLALFQKRLETVGPLELHKFARAFCLMMLGHLPTRPETCPFCIQYGRDRECQGCGYAKTHGRCDADDSAFSLFIEAFIDLGRAIHQDVVGTDVDFEVARNLLRDCIRTSEEATESLQRDLSEASCSGFMQLKAGYLESMIGIVPAKVFAPDVGERSLNVLKMLKDYW
jgi:hypothetical protein